MTSRQFVQEKTILGDYLMRYGISGDAAFHILAFHYVFLSGDKAKKIPSFTLRKWQTDHDRIEHDPTLLRLLDSIISEDPTGIKLPEWYQFFIGRRFREGSGKFFTPKPIASAMARMLPVMDQAVIMDPSCGGGTFLVEASSIWDRHECTLIANDVEPSLVDLATIVMLFATPTNHLKIFSTENIFDKTTTISSWSNKVDYILANPPFSLRIDLEQHKSRLYSAGYRNSDAIFIDTALKLLKPGGRLVCLLPHSLIANADFADFRKIVEEYWHVLAVICLPEGVFQLSAGTTTRADIVILEKKEAFSPVRRYNVVFASVPSVGVRLNNNDKAEVQNDLEKLVNDTEVKKALQI